MRIGTASGRMAAFAAALAAMTAFSTKGRASDHLAEAVERAARPLLEEHGAPGLAIAVTVRGERRFFNFGLADRKARRPVSETTLFEIGSISKTFTATLGCYGVALGKLSLDDHPSRFMPALADTALDGASLLELGAYAAGGLPLQFPDGVTEGESAIAYFRTWRPEAKPGRIRRYSNPSIGLFGRLAASAMNRDFASLMEGEVFPSLRLSRTFISVPSDAAADYAWGYGAAGKPVRVSPGAFDAEAYGVKSTASDMIRFVEANLRAETLEPAMRSAVACAQSGYFRAGPMVQGLGWERIAYPTTLEALQSANSREMIMEAQPVERLTPPDRSVEAILFDKTGSTRGFGAYVAFVPDRQVGIVILANRSVPIPARITAAHAILEALAARP